MLLGFCHTKDMSNMPRCARTNTFFLLIYTVLLTTIDHSSVSFKMWPRETAQNASWFSWGDGAFNGQHDVLSNCAGQNRTISHCTRGSPHGKKWSRHPQNRIQMEVCPQIIPIGSHWIILVLKSMVWLVSKYSKWYVRVAMSRWFSLSSLDSLGFCAASAHFDIVQVIPFRVTNRH